MSSCNTMSRGGCGTGSCCAPTCTGQQATGGTRCCSRGSQQQGRQHQPDGRAERPARPASAGRSLDAQLLPGQLGAARLRPGRVRRGPPRPRGPQRRASALFDATLKGDEAALTDTPPVRLFVMGENRWRAFDRYPVAGTHVEDWHLQPDGGLARSAAPDSAPDVYDYDPANPVPTVGGSTMLAPTLPPGPFDQRDVEARPDVLSYTSGPRTEASTVLGAVWSSTSRSPAPTTCGAVPRPSPTSSPHPWPSSPRSSTGGPPRGDVIKPPGRSPVRPPQSPAPCPNPPRVPDAAP
jgi:X-Pro dipeptidyl-peptidase C-terminal non-catalytic domain